MDPKKLIAPSVVAAVLAFGAAPADAQRSDRHGNDHGRSRHERVGSHEEAGSAARAPHAAAAGETRTRQPRVAAARDREFAVPRAILRPQQETRAEREGHRQQQERAGREPRGREQFRPPWRGQRRDSEFRRRDRGDGPGFEFRRRDRDNRRSFEGRRFWGPTVRVAPRFKRVVPYRVYTPRLYGPELSLRFGIFFGRPYAHRFVYPVPLYGYPAAARVVAYGGVSLEIWPGEADVYVDGYYVGIARSFDGGAEPLTLAAGWHRIELQAPGYVPMVFDVEVLPGQVIPYRGAMQPGY